MEEHQAITYWVFDLIPIRIRHGVAIIISHHYVSTRINDINGRSGPASFIVNIVAVL